MFNLYSIQEVAAGLKTYKCHSVRDLSYIGGTEFLIPWLNFGTNPGYFVLYIRRMSGGERPYDSRMSAVCLFKYRYQPYVRHMSVIPNLPICQIFQILVAWLNLKLLFIARVYFDDVFLRISSLKGFSLFKLW